MNIANITTRKDIIEFYESFTQIKREENVPESFNLTNPIAAKLLFGNLEDFEINLMSHIRNECENYKKAFIELFMFSDLKLLSIAYTSTEFDMSVGRGDFDFLAEIVEGLDTRNAFCIEEFAEAVWLRGVPSPDFIKPFFEIKAGITRLKEKYNAQYVLKNRLNAIE